MIISLINTNTGATQLLWGLHGDSEKKIQEVKKNNATY